MQRVTKIFVAVALSVAVGSGVAGLKAQVQERKVTICHGTASQTNPYVVIVVDESALAGHFNGGTPQHGKNSAPDGYPDPVTGSCDTPSGPNS